MLISSYIDRLIQISFDKCGNNIFFFQIDENIKSSDRFQSEDEKHGKVVYVPLFQLFIKIGECTERHETQQNCTLVHERFLYPERHLLLLPFCELVRNDQFGVRQYFVPVPCIRTYANVNYDIKLRCSHCLL